MTGTWPSAYPMPVGMLVMPAMPAQQEIDMLKGQAEYFEDSLDGIKKRIEELEAEGKDK